MNKIRFAATQAWSYEDMSKKPIDPDTVTAEVLYELLADRVGPAYLRQRLGIETEGEQPLFGQGERRRATTDRLSADNLIRLALKVGLVYERGRRNALNIQVTENQVLFPHLPPALDGLTLLHISDLHLDMNADFPRALSAVVRELEYDVCVLTGDYRYRTAGSCKPAVAALTELRHHLSGPVYAVLGNHDSIRMAPAIEALDIRLLLNEHAVIERDRARLYLAGVDDPHFYRADDLARAASGIPEDAPSVLLSHSPELFLQAAHVGFDLMLCGHTHGGQISLPGGLPLTLNANCPRRYGRGAWRHGHLQGYTSVGAGSSIVDVRFNCRPEVTLHRLRRG